MNTKRTLAIAVAVASLATTGLALAGDWPGRGYGPQTYYGPQFHYGPQGYYGERHQYRGPRFSHDRRDDRRHDRRDDRRYDAVRKHDGRFEDRIDRRQENQEARIREGLRSGELTRKEAAKLEKQQDRIERMQDRFDNDGRYSEAERERLRKALTRADRAIEKQSNDDDTRNRGSVDGRRFLDYYRDAWRGDRAPYQAYRPAPWQRWTE